MQHDSVSPAICQGVGIVIGVKDARVEAAEEPHHCQVELTVSAVTRRVDQPARPCVVNNTITGPQITM